MSASELLLHPATLKNVPVSDINSQNNSQTSKACLLKTIIVPKNLKSLKEALPGSKYEGQPKKPEPEGKFRRANSANNIRPDIPQVISSPKMGENRSELIKYGLNRPYPIPKKSEPYSERLDKPEIRVIPKMERNNSVDYIRRRV